MCEPAAWAFAISGIMAAGSSIQQGKAQQAAADFNTDVANENAKIKQGQADDAIKRGEIEEQRHRVRISGKIGQQKTALAGSGVELDSGSALDVLGDTAYAGAQEISDINQNARREAFGFQVGAMDSTASARLSKASGANARSGSLLTAGSQLVGAAGASYAAATQPAPAVV